MNAGSTIGGTDPGTGNVIAFNAQSGVMMSPDSEVLSNSIFSNGSKGIDVEGAAFSYPAVPAPQLSYAVESPGSSPDIVQVQVGGVINVATLTYRSSSSIACTIQVFATLNGVPPGQGRSSWAAYK